MKKGITDRMVLVAINDFFFANGYSPTTREVMEVLDIRSSQTMNSRFKRMRRDGLLDYVDYSPRTLTTDAIKFVLLTLKSDAKRHLPKQMP